MEPNISLHSKLSSIMETMAESAMAELCKAVDEDTVELRLELSRLQTLNSALTEKVDTLECELTAARSDAPGLLRSHRTVAIQTDDDDVNESESPVINGVFGKDWCLNLWKDRFRTNQKIDAQQVDDDMNASMPLESFSPIDVPVLEKGAEFYSFESFSEAIESWQRSNFVELYKRSSRTVENAKKRARKKSYSENLVFAELDFACAHGSKGPDVKRCPFTIKVRVTPDGRKLYIKDISPGNCHNHELSQAVLTGSDPEHVDVIQVKVEDYLEGAGGSFAQETLSQETHNSAPWAFQEVQTFLGILAEEEVQRELVGAVRNRRVFQLVSQRMAAEGFQRTCGQCQMKCKKLRCEYRKIKEKNRTKAWRWFKLVDAVYGRRPAIKDRAQKRVDTATLLEAMMESVVEDLDSGCSNNNIQLVSVGEPLTSPSSSPSRTSTPAEPEPGPSARMAPRRVSSRKRKRVYRDVTDTLEEMSTAAWKLEEMHERRLQMYMEDAHEAKRQEAQLIRQKLGRSAAVNDAFFGVVHSRLKPE
ncbi:uncharacterized protein LOC133465966 isoform X1 [Phyllopteryx taeniolatus]|uniref:uncharacterized protein LOC133465966 isoform X1 n=1 Tax=Phyllopteryx taeniolatus TaxID=161469 RepID=UPI002AD4B97B|nr:uncharacterized protein LOC133465966 isoform X1 [Phyllopteryx taeniolatus]